MYKNKIVLYDIRHSIIKLCYHEPNKKKNIYFSSKQFFELNTKS